MEDGNKSMLRARVVFKCLARVAGGVEECDKGNNDDDSNRCCVLLRAKFGNADPIKILEEIRKGDDDVEHTMDKKQHFFKGGNHRPSGFGSDPVHPADPGYLWGYDSAVCLELMVPCRFVSDHPCCEFPMPVGMVARARAMDGSADLKWRKKKKKGSQSPERIEAAAAKLKPGFPRPSPRRIGKLPQGRSLEDDDDSFFIEYTHASSESDVRNPVYHYDGDPAVIEAVLGQCWRILYLKCNVKNQEEGDRQRHPCCMLVTDPGPETPADNVLTRWLAPSSSGVPKTRIGGQRRKRRRRQ